MGRIRALLVYDHALLRESLKVRLVVKGDAHTVHKQDT